jgi:hypothetical protein
VIVDASLPESELESAGFAFEASTLGSGAFFAVSVSDSDELELALDEELFEDSFALTFVAGFVTVSASESESESEELELEDAGLTSDLTAAFLTVLDPD